MQFSDSVALVAGAGGMGTAIAARLLAAGARVMAVDLRPPPESFTGEAAAYRQGDLSDEGFVRSVVADTVDTFGSIDLLVNTVGVLWLERDRSFAETEVAVWDQVMAVNLRSCMLTAREVVPHMTARGGGSMVHFSSIDALAGDPVPQDAYGASKAALIRLSRSIAVQYASRGIRSNCILPGPVHTSMQARWDERPDLVDSVAARIPLGRLGTPEDMAAACLFLLSDQAAWITGTELIVDGGIKALP
jgi:NAD(P)-dependent dehydrogenase (short-subunit alcohol dehydrogenase family)